VIDVGLTIISFYSLNQCNMLSSISSFYAGTMFSIDDILILLLPTTGSKYSFEHSPENMFANNYGYNLIIYERECNTEDIKRKARSIKLL